MNENIKSNEPENENPSSDESYLILEELGFSPNSINKFRDNSIYFSKDKRSITQKISWLKERGFENPIKLIEKTPPIIGLTEELMGVKISWLKEYGFNNPIELIEKMPSILTLAKESMERKTLWLKEKGIDNPVELIEKIPQILGMAEESMNEKILWLKKEGFDNPIELIEKNPQILSLAKESMGEKISSLEKQKFSNPITLIEKMPRIMNLDKDSVVRKISWLKERGFSNPVKLIEERPQILGLAEESMGKKIEYVKRCIHILGNYDDEEAKKITVKYIETISTILGAKFDKIAVLVRVLTMFTDPQKLPTTTEANRLVFFNIENIIIALEKIKNVENLTFSDFIKTVKDIKKEDLQKEKKQEIIYNLFKELEKSKSSGDEINENFLKILQRYKRGYNK